MPQRNERKNQKILQKIEFFLKHYSIIPLLHEIINGKADYLWQRPQDLFLEIEMKYFQ